MSIPKSEIGLAGYVALRMDNWNPATGCPAWIESRSDTCRKSTEEGTALCRRHRNVAVKRHEQRKEEAKSKVFDDAHTQNQKLRRLDITHQKENR